VSGKKQTGRPDPRKAALAVLEQFFAGKGLLDRLTDRIFAQRPGMSKKERALVTALVFGTVRHLGRVDFALSLASDKPLEKTRPQVLCLLRLGAFQLLFMDRPPALVVDWCVHTARKKAPWSAGYVNAVLRRVAKGGRVLPLPDFETDPVAHLATAESFPPWMVARWAERLGAEEARNLCRSQNAIPPITVRENPTAPGFEPPGPFLEKVVENLAPGRYAPGSLTFVSPKRPLAELSAHKKGFITVQDEGSQLVGLLVGARPGERVLDACCGMGAKTGQLVQAMDNQGFILATDTDAKKLPVLEREMERIGAKCVEARAVSSGEAFTRADEELMDRVLVDAPCSGLGALRKHPDAKWTRTAGDLVRHQANQLSILENAARSVAPGGVLVYAVCSLEPEENEDVAAAFLEGRPDFSLVPAGERLPAAARAMAGDDGFFRSWPHRFSTDGFFAAVFARKP